MPGVDRTNYRIELNLVAKTLGLSTRGNVEASIINHCRSQLAEWIKVNGCPNTLTKLLDLFAASLDMQFVEIYGDDDLNNLLKEIPPVKEPIMARLPFELDDSTDAVTICRSKCEPWERRFLAVLNCRSWHFKRVFFTKWHEIAHRIIAGQQLRLAFRKTSVNHAEPQEILVDRVAGELAFYPSIFRPAVEQELSTSGRLTFDGADRVRQQIAPEASLQSTVIACLRYCQQPVWFIICVMGYKRELQRKLTAGQGHLLPLPQPKLRVRDSGCSPAASDLGITLYRNMRVPDSSIVTKAFGDDYALTHTGRERLEQWQISSSGPIGQGTIEVEAFKRDNEVWAILCMDN